MSASPLHWGIALLFSRGSSPPVPTLGLQRGMLILGSLLPDPSWTSKRSSCNFYTRELGGEWASKPCAAIVSTSCREPV